MLTTIPGGDSALCLGSHYEYDAPTIKSAYGGKAIETYMAPGERMGGTTHGVGWGRRQYHPGQKKGDQTDYGEYNILILEHLAGPGRRGGAIDLKSLVPHWQRRLSSPEWGAWRCTQTKQTLQQVEAGTPLESLGGMSNAMGMRSAAAIAAFDTEAEAAAAARATSFTHRHEEAIKHGQTALPLGVALDHLPRLPGGAHAGSGQLGTPRVRPSLWDGPSSYLTAARASRLKRAPHEGSSVAEPYSVRACSA